jgi:hypothetical protein
MDAVVVAIVPSPFVRDQWFFLYNSNPFCLFKGKLLDRHPYLDIT